MILYLKKNKFIIFEFILGSEIRAERNASTSEKEVIFYWYIYVTTMIKGISVLPQYFSNFLDAQIKLVDFSTNCDGNRRANYSG